MAEAGGGVGLPFFLGDGPGLGPILSALVAGDRGVLVGNGGWQRKTRPPKQGHPTAPRSAPTPRRSTEASALSEHADFIGNVPEYYERNLGPVIFSGPAADLARRVVSHKPERVLEIAAGTGLVTRLLRDLLPTGARLTATDINPPMLDVARTKFRPGEQVVLQPADASALPFPDGAFDAVVCQFGVMFFPDKAQSYREVHRVLAPGGRYLFNVWDSHRHNPFGRITHELVQRLFPSDAPQFFRVPFGYHAIDPIKEALIEARLTDITVAVVRQETEVANLAAFAHGLVYGSPLAEQIKARGSIAPDRVLHALIEALRGEIGADPGCTLLQTIVFEAGKHG